MIGNGNVFKFSQWDANTAASGIINLKPAGDLPGLYWGSFRVWATNARDYSKPSQNPNNWANSYLFTIEVNGEVVFSHRHIQRNWWRPRQLYQNGVWNGAIWTNFNWLTTAFADNLANPAGGLIGTFAGVSNGAPLRSYQSAFFEPAEQGPGVNPMGFGVSNIAIKPTQWYWCNCEPVFFTASVAPGETFVLRSRRFREVPNPALDPPINDTPPQAGQAAEPDEIESSEATAGGTLQNIEGWVVRVGPHGETLAEIGTITVSPGEPGIDD